MERGVMKFDDGCQYEWAWCMYICSLFFSWSSPCASLVTSSERRAQPLDNADSLFNDIEVHLFSNASSERMKAYM